MDTVVEARKYAMRTASSHSKTWTWRFPVESFLPSWDRQGPANRLSYT